METKMCIRDRATGKRNFLDIAIRYADCVCREIGTGEGQPIRVPGHQICLLYTSGRVVKVEMAFGNNVRNGSRSKIIRRSCSVTM